MAEFKKIDSILLLFNEYIPACEKRKHFQVIAFSAYKHVLVQTCFDCRVVRYATGENNHHVNAIKWK